MLSRKYQTAKQEELCTGLAASQPRRHACSPIGWHSWRASSDWPAENRLNSDWLASDRPSSDWPAGAAAGVSAGLGRASGFSCFLLPVAVWESTAEVFLSFRIKGPWLYGDGEAHTEHVQNDFYKQG